MKDEMAKIREIRDLGRRWYAGEITGHELCRKIMNVEAIEPELPLGIGAMTELRQTTSQGSR